MTEEQALEADFLKKLADAYAGDPWVKGGWLRAKKTQLEKDILAAAIERLISDGVVAKQGDFPEDRYSLTTRGVFNSSTLSRKADALLQALHRVLRAKFENEPNAYLFSWSEVKAASDGTLSDDDFMFARKFVQDTELSKSSPHIFDPNKMEMAWLMRSDTELLIQETPRGMVAFIRSKTHEEERRRQEELGRFNSGFREALAFTSGGMSPAELTAAYTGYPATDEQPRSRLHDEDVEKSLESIAPYLAACYRQLLADFEAPDRETFVGPAAELREVLVGVLRERAPDDKLLADGVKPDESARGFTQRQRANFILRQVKKDASSALTALTKIEQVDGLARDIYKRASKGTHKGVEHAREIEHEMTELKTMIGYLNALLRDLLL